MKKKMFVVAPTTDTLMSAPSGTLCLIDLLVVIKWENISKS